MNKKVLITIKGISGDLLEDDEIEMMVTGSLYEKNGKLYIQYIDTALDTEIETKTSIKVETGRVSISRFGATNTHMVFEKDISHFTHYDTAFGNFEIVTHTHDIILDKCGDTVNLEVSYTLEIDKKSIGRTRFELSAKEL